jgi:hypothetical protein
VDRGVAQAWNRDRLRDPAGSREHPGHGLTSSNARTRRATASTPRDC